MNNEKNPEVIFLRVTDSNTKIKRILHIIHQHFLIGDSSIIFVPNQQSALFIDNLLWKTPLESFLPHGISDKDTKAKIVITESNKNLNGAKIALNLQFQVCQNLEQFEKIYELYDESDAQKKERSIQKIEQYKIRGALGSSIS